ncbi:hypothetical protein RM780_10080 [Streptomyces sp. DSM 44917]|uniref:Uncharacterized protein n=1 Tax=Streptomyces boetiae TaxID=3075541 RepID=A0ABU2L6W4_9ACTN|nr:hypothetical protein [Streptomyces sp. DSM 44917]MDT0307310.1 hypothetical protein [Streptomyces sp. DSM 44917]
MIAAPTLGLLESLSWAAGAFVPGDATVGRVSAIRSLRLPDRWLPASAAAQERVTELDPPRTRRLTPRSNDRMGRAVAYATVDDVAARLGRELDDGAQRLAAVLLKDVEHRLRARIADLDERAAAITRTTAPGSSPSKLPPPFAFCATRADTAARRMGTTRTPSTPAQPPAS